MAKKTKTRKRRRRQRGGGLAAAKKGYEIGQKILTSIPKVTKYFLNPHDQAGMELAVKNPWKATGVFFDYLINGKKRHYLTDPKQIKDVMRATEPMRNRAASLMKNKLRQVSEVMKLAKKEKARRGANFNQQEFLEMVKRKGLV